MSLVPISVSSKSCTSSSSLSSLYIDCRFRGDRSLAAADGDRVRTRSSRRSETTSSRGGYVSPSTTLVGFDDSSVGSSSPSYNSSKMDTAPPPPPASSAAVSTASPSPRCVESTVMDLSLFSVEYKLDSEPSRVSPNGRRVGRRRGATDTGAVAGSPLW
ncbi:hypothetical protein DFJ73DRAFT_815027 [Zopfochytrium polystomum]|nr:hypothetical protein DFJ73DRAFT_815027 [Zopfochytrium polystomum]